LDEARRHLPDHLAAAESHVIVSTDTDIGALLAISFVGSDEYSLRRRLLREVSVGVG